MFGHQVFAPRQLCSPLFAQISSANKEKFSTRPRNEEQQSHDIQSVVARATNKLITDDSLSVYLFSNLL